MIISFAWTTPALLAGRKTVTRRNWPQHYARRFKPDTVHQAWSKSPRFHGVHVAEIKLVGQPKLQDTAEIPDLDWEAEGFAYLESIGALTNGSSPRAIWNDWRANPRYLYVVRFELIRVIPHIESAHVTKTHHTA